MCFFCSTYYKLFAWGEGDSGGHVLTGASAAGRKDTRRSEKAKVAEEALLTRSSKAKKTYERLSAYLHATTNTKHTSTQPRYTEV
jgi:hypothetical protein